MSQTGMQIQAIALAAANFAEGLTTNVASIVYNIPMSNPVAGIGRRMLIRAILAITDENFGPEFNFFGSAAGSTTNPDTDSYVGRFGFTSVMGERLSGAGLWRYYNDGMAIPYYDADATNQTGNTPQLLHVVLQNIDANAKLVRGASQGRCNATFWLEPTQPW